MTPSRSTRGPFLTSTAKTYNRIKLATGIAASVVSFLLMLAMVLFGATRAMEAELRRHISHDYVILLAFVSCLGLIESVVTLPLGFYSSYYCEHRFHLSNQTLGGWVWERIKGMFVGLPLAAAVIVVLYYCINAYGGTWWLPVSIVLTFLSVVLARLAPVFVMPLFYKFTPLENGSLKERITRLCADAGVRFEGIFSFDMSKNTRKANAGFTGIGKAKRIVLGDTLLKEFTEDEIETVFAHELGHYKHLHIPVAMGMGVLSTFVGLFVTALLYSMSVPFFGFTSIAEIAALPLLGLWLSLFGLITAPLGNLISRRHERQADAYAVHQTKDVRAYVAALRKLETMNLADPEPHPLVEFLFYSHPPIAKRIRVVEGMNPS